MAIVRHMIDGWSAHYKLDPIEALISAAIIEDKRTTNLTTEVVRDEYRQKIIFGKKTAAIGDLAVRIN